MNKLTFASLAALLALAVSCATKSADAPPAASKTSPATETPATVAPTSSTATNAAAELRELMQQDDDAMDEVDKWIVENDAFTMQGAGVPQAELNARIRKRLDPIGAAYVDFIKRHPNDCEARIAYASYLDHTHEDEAVFAQLDQARALCPTNPAVWNQLANLHGHTGDPKLAFDYYAKAIELDPTESVYYHNFGTTVYLFRKDAMEHYGITELQVFEKALDLYAKAMQHDPTNFLLAADVAQTYYGIRPLRTDDALRSWTNALSLAQTEIDREGVYIHFARIKLLAGRFDEARAHLNAVTNEAHAVLKDRVAKSLEQHMHDAQNTNAPPAESPPSDAATPANKD